MTASRTARATLAVEVATPMVAAALAVARCLPDPIAFRTMHGVADRFAHDAADELLDTDHPVSAAAVFAAALGGFGYARRPGLDYARAYLEDRVEIADALERAGIRFGGPMLSRAEAATRAETTAAAWAADVAAGSAPHPDQDRQWRAATLDAWRLLRPRSSTAWWTGS